MSSSGPWPTPFTWSGRHRAEEFLKRRARILWEAREEQGDFLLDLKGQSFRVHSCILAAASPVFCAMLQSEMLETQEQKAELDADPADVLVVIRFAYLGALEDFVPLQLPGILHLAHKYEMGDLLPLCCEAMVEFLSADTVVEFVRALRFLEGVPMDLTNIVLQPQQPPPTTVPCCGRAPLPLQQRQVQPGQAQGQASHLSPRAWHQPAWQAPMQPLPLPQATQQQSAQSQPQPQPGQSTSQVQPVHLAHVAAPVPPERPASPPLVPESRLHALPVQATPGGGGGAGVSLASPTPSPAVERPTGVSPGGSASASGSGGTPRAAPVVEAFTFTGLADRMPSQQPALYGAPPEQPQQANQASLFRVSSSDLPAMPQHTSSMDFFGGNSASMPVAQPATSLQPQLLHRPGFMDGMQPLVAGPPDGALRCSPRGEGAPAAALAFEGILPPDEASCYSASPVAHTFVTIARLIAASPQLQMAVLRGL